MHDNNVAYLTEHYCECRDDIRQSGGECHMVNKIIEVCQDYCSFITLVFHTIMPSYIHTHMNIHAYIHAYLCKAPSLPDPSSYECNNLCNGEDGSALVHRRVEKTGFQAHRTHILSSTASATLFYDFIF